MSTPIPCASFSEKVNFLSTVLDAEEKRRRAVENKSAILIAANAILLNAVVGWGFPLVTSGQPSGFFVILTLITFSAIVLSTLFAAEILEPFRNQKQRRRKLDLGPEPDQEYNLFWFMAISKYKKGEYQREIETLNEQAILSQLTSQAHNLSRILRDRYISLDRSFTLFVIAVAAFTILAFSRMVKL